ncbi:right-handed parallel beta-helix repeat-containing protein [bacterium]|nr:right-handed parallel beta-helix repeat-containing protein [bacterium]
MEIRVDGDLVFYHAMDWADDGAGAGWRRASESIAQPNGVDLSAYLGGVHELCLQWNRDGCGSSENDNMLVDFFTLEGATDPMELTVKADGSGDVATIQEALDTVAEGGTVYLADGVFEGTGNRNIVWPPKRIHLRSQSLNPETCSIRPNSLPLPRSNPWRRGEPVPTRNDRETFHFGILIDCCPSGSQVTGITFANCSGDNLGEGGGLLIRYTSPTVSDCIFRHCSAPTQGGGLMLRDSSSEVINCRFEYNESSWGGGLCIGGSLSNPILSDCTFVGNHSSFNGGALDVYANARLSMDYCVFWNNDTLGVGGALALYEANDVIIQNCTFSENGSNVGGTVYAEAPFTFWFNIISFSDDGIALTYNPPVPLIDLPDIACCNFFGNVEGDWVGNIAELLGADGNFSADPQFCGSIGNGNFQLQSDSSCAPAHNDCGSLIGARDVNCGESSAGISTWSDVKRLY